ncbi:MAG: ABC transporter permease subunit [bacterium]|nr:ABC transporter permease subunit [bacterium]
MIVSKASIRRVWNAYTIEWTKAYRSKTTFVGPLLVTAAVIAITLVHPVRHDDASDYAFLARATSLVLDLLAWLLTLIYCAGLISSELDKGTIRLLLVRPLLRREFLAAKILHGITYAFVLMALVSGSSWCVVLAFGDLNGVGFGGEVVFTSAQMASSYGLAALIALAPMTATVAYAVMISSLTRSAAGAIGAAVGLWVLVDLVKYPLRIAPFVFTSYTGAPWQVFANQCDGFETSWLPMGWYALGSSAVAAVLFTTVALIVLNRRNLQA